MSVGGRLFARYYDSLTKGTERAGLADRRANLLAGATGRVLEVGGGTGANLGHYGPGVEELTVTDPEEPMVRRLRAAAEGRATVFRAPAEDLPFTDDSFDTVACTLVLCSVADQPRALREIRRVLRPGGQLLFIEHVRSEEPGLARWQDRLNFLARVVGHGCNCNRPTLESIEAAGFSLEHLERGELPKAPPFVRPMVAGRATA